MTRKEFKEAILNIKADLLMSRTPEDFYLCNQFGLYHHKLILRFQEYVTPWLLPADGSWNGKVHDKAGSLNVYWEGNFGWGFLHSYEAALRRYLVLDSFEEEMLSTKEYLKC